MEIKEIYQLFLKCNSIIIDTRKVLKNAMFVAIKGDKFDANLFAKEALDKGASYVIIDNKDCYIDERTILVKDGLQCLQNLAKHHRESLKTIIIALTGSNGKTTTKELINCVLSQKYKTTATFGNLNNHIGVPLTLLSFTSETEVGIVEMGANHQKEIAFLCEIAQPDFGYITNFGKAHLEGFGGIEGVIKGKSEMFQYLLKHDERAFVNLDDKIQIEKSTGIKTISFGLNNENAFVNINKIAANPFVEVEFNNMNIKSNLIGLYNSNNINAAITIGKYFKIDDIEIKNAIESYIPENNRSQLIHKNNNEIILDAYNANPSSMAVAIENFLQLEKHNKIMILGDMFELGEDSFKEHQSIVTSLENQINLQCFFIGEYFYANKNDQLNFNFYKSFDEFAVYLSQINISNQIILIKGSRGMALERVLNFI